MTLFDGTYILDPTHSRVGFWVRHAMVTKMRGEFTDYESYIVLGDTCKIDAIIQTPSISTSNTDRDYHLLNEDFFETEQYPTITFFSTKVEWVHNYRASVTGDLTIKGETHPVTLDVHVIGVADDPMGHTRMGFEGYLKINRTDFNMSFNTPMESGGLILGEEVTIEIEGSAILQAPGTPIPDLRKRVAAAPEPDESVAIEDEPEAPARAALEAVPEPAPEPNAEPVAEPATDPAAETAEEAAEAPAPEPAEQGPKRSAAQPASEHSDADQETTAEQETSAPENSDAEAKTAEEENVSDTENKKSG